MAKLAVKLFNKTIITEYSSFQKKDLNKIKEVKPANILQLSELQNLIFSLLTLFIHTSLFLFQFELLSY